MVLGALYVTLVPAQLSSTALLLFPQASGSSGPGEEPITATQVHIVDSTPVLARAGKSVRPALSAAEVQHRVKVAATTSNLISIQAISQDARQAQSLAQAVAETYIALLNDSASALSAVPAELSSREASLKDQLGHLRSEIATTTERLRGEKANSSDGRLDAQLQAQLIHDQTGLLVELDKVKQAVDDASNGATPTPDIVQPAAPATGPGLTGRLVTSALVGALLAVAGTALLLVIRRRRDPRLRARDDLADAVGSSLLAVVHGRPQTSVAGWLALFETYDPPAEEAWAFRQVLHALAAHSDSRDPSRTGAKRTPVRVEHPSSLTVVALSGDQRAVAVGPQLAVLVASLGITTRFVVATRHDSVSALYAACATEHNLKQRTGLALAAGETVPARAAAPRYMSDPLAKPLNGRESKESRVHAALGDNGATHPPREMTRTAQHTAAPTIEPDVLPTRRDVDLTIVFTVVDRKEPTLLGLPATAVTMLAVSPGVATRDELARLAIAVDDAGRRIDGVVVADPDPSDRTTGRRTLDERATQAPLPLRMTGPSEVSASAVSRNRPQ